MKPIILILIFSSLVIQVFAKTIKVTNGQEFLEAIEPGNTIEIVTPTVDFHSYAKGKFVKDQNAYHGKYFSIYYLSYVTSGDTVESIEYNIEIHDITNLIIKGTGKFDSTVWITSPVEHANVLMFKNCIEIKLENLTLGHYPEPGYCTGNVILFEDCNQVNIVGCDLFGSGLTGLVATNTHHLTLSKTTIRDCTEQLFELNQCDYLKFDQCRFIRTPGRFILNYSTDNIFHTAIFKNCSFEYLGENLEFLCFCSFGNGACCQFINCRFPDISIDSALDKQWRQFYDLTKTIFSDGTYSNRVEKRTIEN